jgi:hypothetical protein
VTFHPGQLVVRRFIHSDQRIAAVRAALVVADDQRGLLLWSDVGSATMRRTDLAGRPTRHLPIAAELAMPTMLSPGRREAFRSLLLMPPGAAHSVSWGWLPDGTFTGWYVNLETPARRWFGGVDTHDQTLDVLVTADRAWLWKDEEDLAARYTQAQASEIRDEGTRVIALVEAGEFPFNGELRDFVPDRSWLPAPLPAWWDAVRA